MEKFKPASYEDFCEKFDPQTPENFNFAYDVLDAIADEQPDRLAMIHIDDDFTRKDYTFAYFRDQSAKLANALTERGIKKGDRVMLILYRRVEFWVSMLALHKIGALPIPSPSLLTAHDIEQRAPYANVRCMIVEDSIKPRVEEARDKTPSITLRVQVGGETSEGWDDFDTLVDGASAQFTPPSPRPGGDDPFLIFFSSGTTGLPKMVLHAHTYAHDHFKTGAYWHDLEDGDIHLTLSDSGWGKCAWGKFYGQWMSRAVVVVWDFRGKFEPANLLKVIVDAGVTTFCAPPTVYRFMIREDLSAYDLSALRHCTTAGELLNDSVFHTWKEQTGLPIYEGYGQTETTLQIATLTCMEPKPGSIGKPMPGWDIVLLDAEGEEVPTGEEGEICIRLKKEGGCNGVEGLFKEYFEEPQKTADVKCNGFYHTGDKAWKDEDGYFWFMGRVDDLLKSSGYRIGPFEVESALVSHDAVIEAAVTGVPDPVRGQAVKATIVIAPGYTAGDELTKELQMHVKKTTAPYKYPRIVEYVDELPKTISGKIKRAEIRKADLEKYKLV